MDKNNKVLLSIFLAVSVLIGGALAFILDAFIRVPHFDEMRSRVVVPIKLADKTWVNRDMGPKTPGWAPYTSIARPMVKAVIASEDTSFYSHQGIDYHELQESLKKDWEEKRWARGGSTLTQQVVKNVYLSREKSLWRKFKELIWARDIEKVLSKAEILAFYLNMAEWGPSIYGIKEAAWHYFQISPAEITPKQAAFLAMLLPSPIKFHVYFVKKELTPFAKSRVAKILRIMHKMGDLTDEEYQSALSEKLWGITGELRGESDGNIDINEDEDSGIFIDVLEEPETPPKAESIEKGSEDISTPTSVPEKEDSSKIPDVLEEPSPQDDNSQP